LLKIFCEKHGQRKSLGIIIAILGILLFSVYLFHENLNVRGEKLDGMDKTSFSYLPLDYQNLKSSQVELLYSEDFDDGVANHWVTIGGIWVIENNQYKATGVSGERVRSYYSNQSFNNFIYEGDLKLVSGEEIQLIFNVQNISAGVDQGHYCQITLFYEDFGERKDTAILYSTQNGQTEHTQTSYDFNHNEWYHFKIVSMGSNVAFFLNDSLILSYSGLLYSSGFIGVKSMYGPIAYWDNIKVSKFNESDIIHITGNMGWSEAKNEGKCTGNGTYSDPYILEDFIIDGGGLRDCILIENSDIYFRIENCTLLNSGYNWAGIRLKSVSNGTLFNNTASSNYQYGIILESCNINNITKNNVQSNFGDGIYLKNSFDNNISGNFIRNNEVGIYFDYSHNNIISENDINFNRGGGIGSYRFTNSNDNMISGNNISNNGGSGIYLRAGSSNWVSGNTADNNGYIGINVNGYYNTVSGNTADNNSYIGINVNGYYNTVSGNTANNNRQGIRLDRCEWSDALGNTVNNNSDIGLWVSDGAFNEVSENILINNNEYGILMSGGFHTISSNTVNNSNIGIKLRESDFNNINGNEIHHNTEYGIYLERSDKNTIEMNTLTNNYIAIYLYDSESNEISSNIFRDNDVNIEEVEAPLPIEVVISIVVPIVVIALIIVGVIFRKRIEIKRSRLPKDEVSRYKILKERERYETPVRGESTVEMKPVAANISRCPYCRTPMDDDWVYCKKCGSKSERKWQ